MPRRTSPRISFRTLLASVSAALVIVTALAILLLSFGASRHTAFDLLNDQVILALHAVEDGVIDELAAVEHLLTGLAAGDQARRLKDGDREEAAEILSVGLALVPEAHILMSWRQGEEPVALRRDGQGNVNPFTVVVGGGLLEHLEASAAVVPRWTDPVFSGPSAYLYLARRIEDGDRPLFVAAGVALKRFSRDVAAIGQRLGGTAFILYDDDRVLAHPLLSDAAFADGTPTIANVGDPVLARLPAARPAIFAGSNDEPSGVEALGIEDEDGHIELVLMSDLADFGSSGWRVGVHLDASEIRETVSRVFGSAFVSLALLVVGIVGALLLAKLVSRPVTRLAESAAAVARLDFAAVTPPERSPIREIDEQARAFRMMLDGLRLFGTYVPRQLVRRLIAEGRGSEAPSETRELTVMFTDIRSFSAVADRMGPEDTAAFLNRHFGLLEACVTETGGTIDKFIGDAVMAFWGAPEAMEDHAARAVRAACLAAERIAADNARRAGKGLAPVRLRIGLHTGRAVVGNIGSPERVNYTVVGRTVNVAERIEALGHDLDDGCDATVLMSAATAEAAGLPADAVEPLGAHALRGIPEAQEVVRLRHPEMVPARRRAGG